jgi:hypothetical protein
MVGIESINTYDEIEMFESYFRDDLRPNYNHFGPVYDLQPGVECDSFRHFLIPPSTWKEIANDGLKGEYRYFQDAYWGHWGGALSTVRDWVATSVEEVEGMVERGGKWIMEMKMKMRTMTVMIVAGKRARSAMRTKMIKQRKKVRRLWML